MKLTYEAEDIGGLFTDPWQFPQGRATWPDVQSPEHVYMKLAGKRRILRVRQIIYEDPGNPFADEINPKGRSLDSLAPDHEPLSPLPPPPVPEESFSNTKPSFATIYDGGRSSSDSRIPMNSIVKPVGVRALTMDNQIEPSAFRAHRRSRSVAIPLPNPLVGLDEYIAPRTLWRKASVPVVQPPQPLDPIKESARDTRFYGFYDDILQDYKGTEGRL